MERIGAPGHRELQILEIRMRYSQPWLPGILNCLRRGNTLNLTTFASGGLGLNLSRRRRPAAGSRNRDPCAEFVGIHHGKVNLCGPPHDRKKPRVSGGGGAAPPAASRIPGEKLPVAPLSPLGSPGLSAPL